MCAEMLRNLSEKLGGKLSSAMRTALLYGKNILS